MPHAFYKLEGRESARTRTSDIRHQRVVSIFVIRVVSHNLKKHFIP